MMQKFRNKRFVQKCAKNKGLTASVLKIFNHRDTKNVMCPHRRKPAVDFVYYLSMLSSRRNQPWVSDGDVSYTLRNTAISDDAPIMFLYIHVHCSVCFFGGRGSRLKSCIRFKT